MKRKRKSKDKQKMSEGIKSTLPWQKLPEGHQKLLLRLGFTPEAWENNRLEKDDRALSDDFVSCVCRVNVPLMVGDRARRAAHPYDEVYEMGEAVEV